jgi:hypothetical protein
MRTSPGKDIYAWHQTSGAKGSHKGFAATVRMLKRVSP